MDIWTKENDLYSRFKQQKELLQKSGIKSSYLILPAALSLIAAFFEGATIIILVPLMKGIIERNFGFARTFPVIKNIIKTFPHLFSAPNSSIFLLLLGIMIFTTINKNIFIYSASISSDYQYRKFASSLRKCIMERYLSFGKAYFDKNNQGSLYNTLTNFTQLTAQMLSHYHAMLKWIFMALTYLVMIFAISWKLTVFVIIVPPILHYSFKWLVDKIKKTSKFFSQSKSALSSMTNNIFSCIPLIKLYSKEKKEHELFSYSSDRVASFEYSMDKKHRLIEPLQEIVILVILLLLISVTAFLVIKERSGGVSEYLVYFYLIRRLMGSLSTLTVLKSNLARANGPLNEVLKIFDDSEKYFVIGGDKVFSGLKRTIEFKHLTFSYIPKVQVLKDISFLVEKGKITAIVGVTGAGKTTLANLLLRYYDCMPSSIFLDGEDIRNFTLRSLREHIALVSQDTFLFNESLKFNITYGINKVSEELLIDVVKKARLYDFIMALPERFNTLIGDRGVKLSGGEKQRIAIARTLLKNCEIVILDEATSSLDSTTEKLIQQSIKEVIRDKTAIIIAHRLSTIKNADKIVVIEDGRLVEEGPLKSLLAKKGRFYRYWHEQKFG